MKIPFHTAYSDKPRIQLFCGEGRTHQSFKDESNINLIMAKYAKTGLLDHLNTHQGDYGNFIGYEDYHTSMNQIREAEAAFSTIPSKIRERFGNDPGQFLTFVQNPDNVDEMVEMGLARKAPPEPTETSSAPAETTTHKTAETPPESVPATDA